MNLQEDLQQHCRSKLREVIKDISEAKKKKKTTRLFTARIAGKSRTCSAASSEYFVRAMIQLSAFAF